MTAPTTLLTALTVALEELLAALREPRPDDAEPAADLVLGGPPVSGIAGTSEANLR